MAEILVVEDEPHIRALLPEILELAGHTSETACDGVEGLARVMERPRPYDLIYTNLSMPRMDGRSFLGAIRPVVTFRVPRILGSGYPLSDLVPLGLEAGACDVLTYPFDFEVLHAKVDWSLRVQVAYREREAALARRAHRVHAGAAPAHADRTPDPGDAPETPQATTPRPTADEVGFLFRLAWTTGADTELFRQEYLLEGIRARDPNVSQAAHAAVRGLGTMRPPFPSGFASLLTSPIPQIRVQAARVLGRAPGGVTAALPVLRSAFHHRDPAISLAAASAVRELVGIRH